VRVLFVGHPSDRPTDGGGASYGRTVLSGLRRARRAHEWSYLQAVPGKATVQPAAVEQRSDFVWFLSPYYEPVEVPFAVTVWDLGHRELPWFPEVSLSGWTFDQRESFYRYVLPRATAVVVGNGVGARSVRDFYQVPSVNIHALPLPVDVGQLAGIAAHPAALAPFGLAAGSFLLYPAQFWPHKNHVTLVDALARLRERGSTLKLVFTGSDKGNRAHVERYVAERGLGESVRFLGFVDGAVLQQLYLAAAALLFGSLMGPDNLPPLEAMALGCPVACANYAGAHEQLGEAALYFEGLDAAGAAAQIEKLADPALRARLVSRGRELVRSRDVGGYVERMMQILDDLGRVRRLWAPGNGYRHL
jgi:glycosyltransferase involved in cell wall biosynthesis